MSRRRRRDSSGRPPDRKCGTCTACCTTHSIPEHKSDLFEACPKVCASGCSVYATRPSNCRAFQCLWKLGVGSDEDRPDKIGAVLDQQTIFGEPTMVAYLLHFTPAAGRILTRAVERAAVIVIERGGRRILGPPYIVGPMMAKAAQSVRNRRGAG